MDREYFLLPVDTVAFVQWLLPKHRDIHDSVNHGFHFIGVNCSHSLPMAVNLVLSNSVKGSYVALLSCLSY